MSPGKGSPAFRERSRIARSKRGTQRVPVLASLKTSSLTGKFIRVAAKCQASFGLFRANCRSEVSHLEILFPSRNPGFTPMVFVRTWKSYDSESLNISDQTTRGDRQESLGRGEAVQGLRNFQKEGGIYDPPRRPKTMATTPQTTMPPMERSRRMRRLPSGENSSLHSQAFPKGICSSDVQLFYRHAYLLNRRTNSFVDITFGGCLLKGGKHSESLVRLTFFIFRPRASHYGTFCGEC